MSGLIDDLTYISYATQREKTPEVTPERWARIFGEENSRAMEERYQRELVEKEIKRVLIQYGWSDAADDWDLVCDLEFISRNRKEKP